MKITVDKFNDFLLYSNKNIEKLIRDIVNESSNASFVALYEDAVMLLDHKTGTFYTSKYDFNPKEGTVIFEDFDVIELTRDTSSFKNAVNNYFEEEAEIEEIKEAYQVFASDQEALIDSVVTESLSEKNAFDIIDYSTLEGINEEVSIKDEPFFKEYQTRLDSHPLTSIKTFSWDKPVKIALYETENVKIVNKNAKSKAAELYKDSVFKSKINEAFNALAEGDENPLIIVCEDYSQIFCLDKADRKTLFGKATLGNVNLMEGRNSLFKKAEEIFAENEDIIEISSQYLLEAEEGEDPADEKDLPKELTPEETDKLIKELEKALDKVEDEKLGDKIETLIKALNDGKETGTDVDTVKESVDILSL